MSSVRDSITACFTLTQSIPEITQYLINAAKESGKPKCYGIDGDDYKVIEEILEKFLSKEKVGVKLRYESNEFLEPDMPFGDVDGEDAAEFFIEKLAILQGSSKPTAVMVATNDSWDGPSARVYYVDGNGRKVDPVEDSFVLNQITQILGRAPHPLVFLDRCVELIRSTGRIFTPGTYVILDEDESDSLKGGDD